MLDNFVKILFSFILGGIIGMEREKNKKPIGLRTLIIITVGACLVTLLSIEMAKRYSNIDVYRGMAQYIVAIGFGSIIFKDKNIIKGITSSALLLPMAVIGMFVGLGVYDLAIYGTVVVFVILKLKILEE